jgi:hypothetical protein
MLQAGFGSKLTNCLKMKQILYTFFVSNEFWNKFQLTKETCNFDNLSMIYRYKTESRNIQLEFFELECVKSVKIVCHKEVVVKSIFFLNCHELTVILNRIPEIRAANPLCVGSQSIKALSCLQKIEN